MKNYLILKMGKQTELIIDQRQIKLDYLEEGYSQEIENIRS